MVMNQPAALNLVQGSRPAIGPGGEVYVVWYEYGQPQSHLRVRRSDDGGQTFGPERTVTDFFENPYSGSPAFRRGFGIALPGIATDMSRGPHRGRVYVTWDEAVDFYDAPFASTGPRVELEPNRFFAAATPFTIGQTLRGSLPVTTPRDTDLWVFSGTRGQTVVLRTDSSATGTLINLRLVCAADTTSTASQRFLAFDQSDHPALVFTLPADGSYYLNLNLANSTATAYAISTTLDTPTPGERARDHRDRFSAWSDDATGWSAPQRLDDDPPWFDGAYPEVTVDGTGAAHVQWMDFRDDPGCGAESYAYLSSSGDGGSTWGVNRRVSDQRSFWSFNACGSANQGDYQGITSDGDLVYPCWSDSRLGDPDVFAEGDAFAQSAICSDPLAVPGGSTATLGFMIRNDGNVEATFRWTIEDDAGWLTSASSGSATVAAGSSQNVSGTFQTPPDCSPSNDPVRFILADAFIPGRRDTCVTAVGCSPPAGVGEGRPLHLELAPPEPNPSSGRVRLGFTLPRAGAARLAIYGAQGQRIRALADGNTSAGAHVVSWDGRDDRGRRIGPGVFYARLDAEGRRLVRLVSVVR